MRTIDIAFKILQTIFFFDYSQDRPDLIRQHPIDIYSDLQLMPPKAVYRPYWTSSFYKA